MQHEVDRGVTVSLSLLSLLTPNSSFEKWLLLITCPKRPWLSRTSLWFMVSLWVVIFIPLDRDRDVPALWVWLTVSHCLKGKTFQMKHWMVTSRTALASPAPKKGQESQIQVLETQEDTLQFCIVTTCLFLNQWLMRLRRIVIPMQTTCISTVKSTRFISTVIQMGPRITPWEMPQSLGHFGAASALSVPLHATIILQFWSISGRSEMKKQSFQTQGCDFTGTMKIPRF